MQNLIRGAKTLDKTKINQSCLINIKEECVHISFLAETELVELLFIKKKRTKN